MSTSGGTILNAALYLIELGLAVQIAFVLTGAGSLAAPFRGPGGRRLAIGMAAIWLLVAVPSLLQLPFPAVFQALRRDPDLIRHHGQIWRVLTSLVVQDGGIAGTIFNLVILALVAMASVLVWGPWLAFGLLIASQLIFNVMATFLSPDTGAGNSGATFGLAATIAGLALVRSHLHWPVLARVLGVVLCGAVLIWLDDAHGVPMLGGILVGALAALIAPSGPAGPVGQ